MNKLFGIKSGASLKQLLIYLAMKNMTLFVHENIHHTISYKKSHFFLGIIFFYSPVSRLFLFHFRGRRKENNSITYGL